MQRCCGCQRDWLLAAGRVCQQHRTRRSLLQQRAARPATGTHKHVHVLVQLVAQHQLVRHRQPVRLHRVVLAKVKGGELACARARVCACVAAGVLARARAVQRALADRRDRQLRRERGALLLAACAAHAAARPRTVIEVGNAVLSLGRHCGPLPACAAGAWTLTTVLCALRCCGRRARVPRPPSLRRPLQAHERAGSAGRWRPAITTRPSCSWACWAVRVLAAMCVSVCRTAARCAASETLEWLCARCSAQLPPTVLQGFKESAPRA
jgi:hypothetical protein